MTDYIIKIPISETELKVSYNKGKLKKMTFIKGKIQPDKWKHIGSVIPLFEKDLNSVLEQYKESVSIEKIEKEKTLYTQMVEIWFEWFTNREKREPKFAGIDGVAISQIALYLQKIAETDEGTLAAWQLILSNWDNLSHFHKKNLHLPYINSKLNIIIEEIKNYGQFNTIQRANDIVNQYYKK